MIGLDLSLDSSIRMQSAQDSSLPVEGDDVPAAGLGGIPAAGSGDLPQAGGD